MTILKACLTIYLALLSNYTRNYLVRILAVGLAHRAMEEIRGSNILSSVFSSLIIHIANKYTHILSTSIHAVHMHMYMYLHTSNLHAVHW